MKSKIAGFRARLNEFITMLSKRCDKFLGEVLDENGGKGQCEASLFGKIAAKFKRKKRNCEQGFIANLDGLDEKGSK